MEMFADYSHALVSLAGVALIVLGQGLHVGIVRGREKLAADAVIPNDYSNPVFRIMRAYQNSAESMPAFIAAVLAAVLLGASPFWVNLLASVHFLLRLAYWYVYVTGLGRPLAGARTFTYVVSWGANLVLGVIAVLTGLF